MRQSIRPLKLALAFCVAMSGMFTLPRLADAGTLEVSPVITELAPGQTTAVVTVTNRGTLPTAAQLRSFAWSQPNGEDRLEPTGELLVSPPLFELEPGRSQVVRLILRPRSVTAERSFRLLLDEIPSASRESTVRLALRLSLPVFALAATDSVPRLEWRLEGGRQITVANRGTRRARVANLAVEGVNGSRNAIGGTGTPYVLPGFERSWLLADHAPRRGGVLRLTGLGDAGPFSVEVATSAR